MNNVWALVPVKAPARSKSRLSPWLSREECAELARWMAADVLTALRDSKLLTGIALLGDGMALDVAGVDENCRLIAEDPQLDLCANLQRAAAGLAAEGVETLLVVPADLPTLRPADVRELLVARRSGVTVCPAARDGGTNALVSTPPDAVEFLFGPDSARRHIEAAARRGFKTTRLELPAFARDIDTGEDLRWLCAQPVDCATRRFLEEIGAPQRLSQRANVAC
jgi:2-phospho-L-lactate guanylyltransferase